MDRTRKHSSEVLICDSGARATSLSLTQEKNDHSPSTSGPTSWRSYSSEVTTPKFPPPPRIPQKRSGFSSSLTWTSSPVIRLAELVILPAVDEFMTHRQTELLPAVLFVGVLRERDCDFVRRRVGSRCSCCSLRTRRDDQFDRVDRQGWEIRSIKSCKERRSLVSFI